MGSGAECENRKMAVQGKSPLLDDFSPRASEPMSFDRHSALAGWMALDKTPALTGLAALDRTSALAGLSALNKTSTLTDLAAFEKTNATALAGLMAFDKTKTTALAGLMAFDKTKTTALAGLMAFDKTKTTALAGLMAFDKTKTTALAGLAGFDRSSALAAVPASFDKLAAFASAASAAGASIRALGQYESHFYLPQATELATLTNKFLESAAFARLPQVVGVSELLRNALALMTRPWVDTRDAMRSIGSFAEIHSIDRLLGTRNPFEDHVSDIWRERLGDWREPATFPKSTAENSVVRTNFYVERGVDLKLADFPPAAFIETLDVTGLRDKLPMLVKIYGAPVPSSESEEEEESLNRANTAHDWLQRFENHLRRFIDDLMTAEFGSDWPKHNLPRNLYDDWQEKKAKAERAGASPWPLIAYADFTHYEVVICSRKNWKVFANFFRRPESVRESLQRLYLPRIATMHARSITHEDALLLYAEIKRLARAFQSAHGA